MTCRCLRLFLKVMVSPILADFSFRRNRLTFQLIVGVVINEYYAESTQTSNMIVAQMECRSGPSDSAEIPSACSSPGTESPGQPLRHTLDLPIEPNGVSQDCMDSKTVSPFHICVEPKDRGTIVGQLDTDIRNELPRLLKADRIIKHIRCKETRQWISMTESRRW